MKIEYQRDAIPSKRELVELYDSVGWTSYTRDPALLAGAIQASLTVVTARAEGAELIGLVAAPWATASRSSTSKTFWSAPAIIGTGLDANSFERVFAPYGSVRQSCAVSGAVQGALNTIQAALPGFARVGSGRVVTIGTNLFQDPVVPYHDYTAAKAALLALTRTFAADLGPRGVTVNMVSGGLLRTTDASSATPEAVFDAIAASTPLQSVTTPAELADAVLFFASPSVPVRDRAESRSFDGGLVKN